MRNKFTLLQSFGILLITVALSTSCLKDHVNYTYTMQAPILQTLSQVRAGIKTIAPTTLQHIGKIYSYGHYIFLNEWQQGIHVIDNSNPSSPKNVGFIKIAGNQDLAIRGSYMYADSYGDLVVLDISDPMHATVKKILDNVFSARNMYFTGITTNPDSIMVITGWAVRDTTVDYETYSRVLTYYGGCANCMMSLAPNASASAPAQGTAGSLATFALINNYLYTLNYSNLSSFDISTPSDPVFGAYITVDFSSQTLFPFKDKLFVGAGNGMYVFDLSANPAAPTAAGQFTHVRSCDPVVTDGDYAYVTLSSGTACMGFSNELDILNVANLSSASLRKTYPMTHPRGLGKDGNTLFICDDQEGLKVYDASDVDHLQLQKQCKDGAMQDIIAQNGLALVLGTNGLYQYDYTDVKNIRLLSTLTISQN